MGIFDFLSPAYKITKGVKTILKNLKIDINENTLLSGKQQYAILQYVQSIQSGKSKCSIPTKVLDDIFDFLTLNILNLTKLYIDDLENLDKEKTEQFIMSKIKEIDIFTFIIKILILSIQKYIRVDYQSASNIAYTEKNHEIITNLLFKQ